MSRPLKVLIQTTIPTTADDWSVSRFSLLAQCLRDITDNRGERMFDVTARDRDPLGRPDAVLSTLDRSEYNQMWLFAVDTGHGLTPEDCGAISHFRQLGGGLVVTRDHMDLGSSICTLGGVGAAHNFHSRNIDPTAPLEVDDPYTTDILWPNFHSGANGDFQVIDVTGPIHPVLENTTSPTGAIRFLPSHPHEGAVSAPPAQHARVIATGVSRTTARPFNIAVAFEAANGNGRAIAQSTFHHFADYNWDTRSGAPSFVSEAPGTAIATHPAALTDVRHYVRNVALWLAGRQPLSRKENMS